MIFSLIGGPGIIRPIIDFLLTLNLKRELICEPFGLLKAILQGWRWQAFIWVMGFRVMRESVGIFFEWTFSMFMRMVIVTALVYAKDV